MGQRISTRLGSSEAKAGDTTHAVEVANGFPEVLLEVRRLVVQRSVDSQLLLEPAALLGSSSDGDDTAALDLGNLASL